MGHGNYTRNIASELVSATASAPVTSAEQVWDYSMLDGSNNPRTQEDINADVAETLEGIDPNAEENQNAFSYVKVGSTTIASDTKTDTLELVAGNNITLTADATNDKVTIAATGGGGDDHNAFANIIVGSEMVEADAPEDTFEIAGSNGVSVVAEDDTITIGLDLSDAITGLSASTAAATRTDYIVAQYAGGNDAGPVNNTYVRRSLANLFKALNSTDINTALGYVPYSQTSANNLAGRVQTLEDTAVVKDSSGNVAITTGDVTLGKAGATIQLTGSSVKWGTSELATQYWVNSQGFVKSSGVTSVAMTVPTGLSVSGSPITSSGTLAVTFASGYAIPTTADVSKGVTAYGWGDHAQAGYLTTSGLADLGYVKTTANQSTAITITGDTIRLATSTAYLGASGTAQVATQTWVNSQGFVTSSGVTSVAMTVPTGLTVSGSPITSSGTLAVTFASGYSIPKTNDVTKGVTAYDWGDHAQAGYLTTSGLADLGYVKTTANQSTAITITGDTIRLASSTVYVGASGTSKVATQDWISEQGFVTSVAMTVPTGLKVSGSPVTGSGTLALSFASGYSIPTTTKQSNWDTAYSQRHTHSNKSVLDGITSTKVSNWDAAYGWGDHAQAGYLDTSGLADLGYVKTTANQSTAITITGDSIRLAASNVYFGALGTVTALTTAKLKSATNATYDSNTITNTQGKQYAVVQDKSGYLSVNVPWESYSNATTSAAGLMSADDKATLNSLASNAVVKDSSGNVAITTGDVTLGKAGATIQLTGNSVLWGTSEVATHYWVNSQGFVKSSGVTSVTMTVPTGLSVSGSPITTSGTLAISFASGYAIPTTADVTKGVTAYGWGDHSQAGYLTTSGLADLGYVKTTANQSTAITITGNSIRLAASNVYFGSSGTATALTTAKLKSTTKATYDSNTITNTQGKQYAVVQDKSGYLSVNVPWSNTTYSNATTSAAGLMSASDKTTLNSLAANAVVKDSSGNVAITTGDVTLGKAGATIQLTGSSVKWGTSELVTQYWIESQGFVTSVAMTVPTGLKVSGSPVTGSGTLALSFASGYSIPTTTKQGQWDTAYTNNHTHSNKSVLDGITSTKVSNWDTAYGWGDHAQAGYLDTSGLADLGYVKTTSNQSSSITIIGDSIRLASSNVYLGALGTVTALTTAKLKSATNATYDSNTVTNTSSRQYAVVQDKSGYLSVNVPWSNTTYSVATTSANGLMSSGDKTKLDNVGITKTTSSSVTTVKIAASSGAQILELNAGGETRLSSQSRPTISFTGVSADNGIATLGDIPTSVASLGYTKDSSGNILVRTDSGDEESGVDIVGNWVEIIGSTDGIYLLGGAVTNNLSNVYIGGTDTDARKVATKGYVDAYVPAGSLIIVGELNASANKVTSFTAGGPLASYSEYLNHNTLTFDNPAASTNLTAVIYNGSSDGTGYIHRGYAFVVTTAGTVNGTALAVGDMAFFWKDYANTTVSSSFKWRKL